jgi:Fur family ferric uptake transcriptional regulator
MLLALCPEPDALSLHCCWLTAKKFALDKSICRSYYCDQFSIGISMKSEIEVFRKFIRNKGLRKTPEREQVVRAVFAIHDHFDVDELYALLRRDNEKISKATIYRTIPLLLESGLIQEAYFEDGHLHYEHIYGHEHHCHLRCLDCGKVIEFTEETVKDVEGKVGERYDFFVTGHKLEVHGHCGKCKVHK